MKAAGLRVSLPPSTPSALIASLLCGDLRGRPAFRSLTASRSFRIDQPLPKVNEAERRVLDEIEAAAFLKACNEKPHGLIFEFALLSGMRPEEYLALQWRDLNFERNTAQVRRELVRHKRVWRFQEPKTKGSKRSVTIPRV